MSAKSKRRAAMKRKGCTDKVRYSNLMQAMNAGVRTGLNWYRCHWCKGYHLTSRDVPRTASKNRQSFSNAKHAAPEQISPTRSGAATGTHCKEKRHEPNGTQGLHVQRVAASTTTRRNRPRPAASARSDLNAERSETTSSRRCATSARQKERDRFYAEQQKARWEAARKVPLSQYDGQELYCNLNDCYYATTDYEEMVDALFAEENISAPEFPEGGVYGCYETKLGLVPEQVEALMEESEYAYEDFELSDAARCDIKAFCESFNEKYAETVYFPNWSVGVVKD